MERRSAIRYLFFIAGGITLLPSCLRDPGKVSIPLKNLDLNADHEDLLAEIAETIIPATDTPGAKALGVHLFVLKMVDDCHEKTDQEKFVNGLNQLEEYTKKRFSSSFIACTPAQRQEILWGIEKNMKAKGENTNEIIDFYQIMKHRTVEGYLNSEYVMTKLVVYELVPGRYNGYFPVSQLKRAVSDV